MFTKVIVGDEGLRGGRDALQTAKVLAPDAELIIATAYPWDSTPSRFVQLGYGNILRDDTRTALRHRRDEAGVEQARIVAIPDTSPARALHRLAEEEHADLIVVGSPRHSRVCPAPPPHSGVGRMLLGDVSRDVLHGAPCAVAVAPLGRDAIAPARVGVA